METLFDLFLKEKKYRGGRLFQDEVVGDYPADLDGAA
jgi:hypothetical protein